MIRTIPMPVFDYDPDSDVMYITFGQQEGCIYEEKGDGVAVKKTLDKRLHGFTIIDYAKRVMGDHNENNR